MAIPDSLTSKVTEPGGTGTMHKDGLHWTTTPPTEPGYYWLRNFFWPDCNALQKQPMIVNLEADMNGELAAVELYRETSITEISGEWYGPISPPE